MFDVIDLQRKEGIEKQKRKHKIRKMNLQSTLGEASVLMLNTGLELSPLPHLDRT